MPGFGMPHVMAVKHVIAFDPGRTTGFCEIRVHETLLGFEIVQTREIAWEDRFSIGSLLGDIVSKINPDSYELEAVVVEAFRLFPHKKDSQVGSDFPSSQVIGIIEAYCHDKGIYEKLVYQPSGNIQRVQVLPEHANFTMGSEHKKDAYRHARYFYLTTLRPAW